MAVVTALLTAAPLGVVANAATGMRSGVSRRAIGDRWNHRIRNAMVVAEISAALVLLLATIVAGAEPASAAGPAPRIRAGWRVPGARVDSAGVSIAWRRVALLRAVDERLAASPGVEQVGVISVAPLSGLLVTVPFAVPAKPGRAHPPSANLRAISPGYFPAVGRACCRGGRSRKPIARTRRRWRW